MNKPKTKHGIPDKWNNIGWMPPWNCEPGWFLYGYEEETISGGRKFAHLFILGWHFFRPL